MSINNIECDSCLSPVYNTVYPPKMADGRAFTDYRPRCMINNTYGNISSHEHRMKLTNNANEIMKQNMMKAYDNTSSIQKVPVNTVPSHLNEQICNANTCNFNGFDQDGIGLIRRS
jgi:hypothetical protein